MQIHTVSEAELSRLVPMPSAIAAVRDAFVGLARGEFEMPVRTPLRDRAFLVMPTHHRPSATAIVKSLSLNFDRRDPAITGTVVWCDLTSTDQLVVDASAVTTLRTGAATGVATDLLAVPDASTCAVIGTGGQAADQVRAVHSVRPLTRLVLSSRSRPRAETLAETLRSELTDVRVTIAADPVTAVRDAQVVCCATTSADPLFALDDLAPDVHVNAIGSSNPGLRELPDSLLADALVVVDDREAVLVEAGEVIHAVASGVLAEADIVELGAALLGGVERAGRTVFKSVGVAAQDWAVAALLAQRLLGACVHEGRR